ncbi:MAG: Ig-like domain-containing protein, partial [Proteobacteria bacterium]|nr:Ig-like domain-containing protein [Pseudomonadota bacterium]
MDIKKLILLVSASALSLTTMAETDTSSVSGSENQINYSYSGDDTRLGIGIDNDGKIIGEFLKSFNTDWNKNWMGELWLSDGAGGLKLDFHRISGAAAEADLTGNEDALRIWKYFLAVDQNTFDDRKFTLGFGSEVRDTFWNVNFSSAITGERLVNQTIDIFNDTVFGTINGDDFMQAREIETIIRNYESPYDWGVGARVGKYFENSLFRLTGGVDFERGDFDSDQLTGSLNLEKYFAQTGHSLALSIEQISKNGEFETDTSNTRANLVYRYDIGTTYKSTTVAEEVQIVDNDRLKQLKLDNRKLIQNKVDLSSMAFFDLDSDVLRGDTLNELGNLVNTIKNSQLASNINIVGHTCFLGSEKHNLDLSKRRALSAQVFFEKNGINHDMIQTDGKGESEPAFDNNGSEIEKNRRVVITFLTVENEYEDIEIADEDLPLKWVKKQVKAPAAWISRALRNPAKHKRTVDFYKYSETEVNTTLGEIILLNQPPVAENDSISVQRNSAGIVIDVLANDSDPDDGDVLSIVDVVQASNGTVINNGDSLTYIPNAGFIGTDNFSYTVSDGNDETDTATVSITVENIAPVANNDNATTRGTLPVVITVLDNDTDSDGTSLSVESYTQPANGSVADNGDGSLTYTANNSFVGTDSFNYTIVDADDGQSTATVTVTVENDNN